MSHGGSKKSQRGVIKTEFLFDLFKFHIFVKTFHSGVNAKKMSYGLMKDKCL